MKSEESASPADFSSKLHIALKEANEKNNKKEQSVKIRE
jgi:hypothetical protein